MTAALEGSEWSTARPGRTLPPGKTRYPFYSRLGGPQDWSGQVRKISCPPGFDHGSSSPKSFSKPTELPDPRISLRHFLILPTHLLRLHTKSHFSLVIMKDILHTIFLYQDSVSPSRLIRPDLTEGKNYEAPLYALLSGLLLCLVVVGTKLKCITRYLAVAHKSDTVCKS